MKGILRPKGQEGREYEETCVTISFIICTVQQILLSSSSQGWREVGGREIHTKYLSFILKEINATDLNDV